MKAKAVIVARPRAGILDPAGDAVLAALQSLGYDSVVSCRIGRRIELEFAADDLKSAEQTVHDMARRLIVNAVLEDYSVEVRAL